MATMFIGDYIKRRRKELALTQEQLCEGLCDAATLSRLETGFHSPRRSLLNALLQRLGLPTTRYFAVVTKNELALESLEKEIVACNVQKRWEDGFAKLDQLRTLTDPDDTLTQQFILRSEALLGGRTGRYTLPQQLDLLTQALRLTVPRFTLDTMEQFLYSTEETKLLNQIAGTYSRMGQSEQALSLLEKTIIYLRAHISEALEGNNVLTMLLFNYARELCIQKQYKACLSVCEETRRICVQYGHYHYLPGALSLRAEALHFLGNDAKSLESYLASYVLHQVTEDGNSAQVARDAKQFLNVDLSALWDFIPVILNKQFDGV